MRVRPTPLVILIPQALRMEFMGRRSHARTAWRPTGPSGARLGGRQAVPRVR